MKNLKKALGTLLVLAMILALAAPALAVDITIDDGTVTGANYAAYQLMTVTEGSSNNFAYTLNLKYADILKSVTGQTTDAAVIAYIAGLDTAGIRAFADAVYKAIVAKPLAPDKTTTTTKFTGVASGYYLIAETKTGSSSDVYSLVMLDTAGKSSITVKTKEEVPTLEKKVKETNDSTPLVSGWQDAADYDIGDVIPFQLTGSVPAQYASYTAYSYTFRDTMSSGLTFNASSVTVKVDGTAIASSNYSVETSNLSGATFEVRFADLKTVTAVKPGSKITVEYTATLNSNATIGAAGNPNEALLKYSNNPYSSGIGETPKDKVIVFTYKLDVDKVDGMDKALSGAGFTLYKLNGTDYVKVGNEITGVTTFTFKGVDAGKYKLVESTVPDGYNKADDVLFTVVAEYDTDSSNPALNVLKIVIDSAISPYCEPDPSVEELKITVVNQAGTELPETGGIGTTIFYIVGGLLVSAAAVLLITKKRMSAKD